MLGPGSARPGLAQTRLGLAHLEVVRPGSTAWPTPARTRQQALLCCPDPDRPGPGLASQFFFLRTYCINLTQYHTVATFLNPYFAKKKWLAGPGLALLWRWWDGGRGAEGRRRINDCQGRVGWSGSEARSRGGGVIWAHMFHVHWIRWAQEWGKVYLCVFLGRLQANLCSSVRLAAPL